MSTPRNPLAHFRTYSYYQVLCVCDSTATAEELSSSAQLTGLFIHRDPNNRLQPHTTVSGGRYVVLIDGAVDAQFVIQSVRWSTVIASDSVTKDGMSLSSTIETDGEMTILEPYGVRFMNTISQVCSILDADPIRLVFVLKTFFVGHKDGIQDPQDPYGNAEIITNVRPMMFVVNDIQAKFNETGAEYAVSFVGVTNGVAKMPYANSIAASITVTNRTRDGQVVSTLGDIFEYVLPGTIKDLYAAHKANLQNEYKQLGADFNIDEVFQPVEYRFVLDDVYKNYKFGTNEELFKHNKDGEPILSFSANPSIETIINEIMLSSAEVVKEASAPTDKKIFKISSALTSTPNEYVLTYYIHQYQQATSVVDHSRKNGKEFTPPKDNLIEFDYIFSGKNTDIKDFDIKMEMGLAFFQTISSSKNLPNQGESQAGIEPGTTQAAGGPASGVKGNARPTKQTHKAPLFLGGTLQNPLYRNKVRPVDTMNFQSLLNRHAALENIIAKMTIAGNPQLLDEMSAMPSDFARQGTEIRKEGETINPEWMRVPTYLKVNIFMPSDNPDGPYAERFWYEGYFQLLTIDNIFNNGTFEQEIEMISLPFSDYLSARTDDDPKSSDLSESSDSGTIAQKTKDVTKMTALEKIKAKE